MTSVGSGSLIIVLLLLLYPSLAAGQLVGTDLVQAVPLVGAAALGHLFFGDVSFAVAGSLLVGAIPGVLIGARISSRAPDHIIRPILVVVLIASGAKLLDAPNEWLLAFLGSAVLVGVVLSLRAVVQGRNAEPSGTPERDGRALTGPRHGLPRSRRRRDRVPGVTIHYERDDEHIVLITIDRPEARNSADMDHFKWLREAWERFDADDGRLGRDRHRRRGRVLHRRRPQDLHPRDHRAGQADPGRGHHRDRRLPPRRRHPRGAARREALEADHRRGQRLLHRRRDGDARRRRHPGGVPRGASSR